MSGNESLSSHKGRETETPELNLKMGMNASRMRDYLASEIEKWETEISEKTEKYNYLGLSSETYTLGVPTRIREMKLMRNLLLLHGHKNTVELAAQVMNDMVVKKTNLEKRIQGYTKALENKKPTEEDSSELKQHWSRINKAWQNFIGGEMEGKSGEDPLVQEYQELLKMRTEDDERRKTSRDTIDTALDTAQREQEIDKVSHNEEDAPSEAITVNFNQHRELIDKLMNKPKEERDKELNEFSRHLTFCQSLGNGELQSKTRERIQAKAEEILREQTSSHTGLRGVMQKVNESIAEKGIQLAEAFMGDEDSITKWTAINALKLTVKLGERTTYSPETVQQVADTSIAQMEPLWSAVDQQKVENMLEAVQKVKENPDEHLNEDARKKFMATFLSYQEESTKLIKQLCDLHRSILTDAVPLSRGDKNSNMFEPDSELRSKLAQIKGQDIWRTIAIYSPFGIFLKEKEIGKDGQDIHLTSVYEQGSFKENPTLALAAQGIVAGIATGTSYGLAKGVKYAATSRPVAFIARNGYNVLKFGLKVSTGGASIPVMKTMEVTLKRLGVLAIPAAAVAAKVYLLHEVIMQGGDFIKRSAENTKDEEILKEVEQYIIKLETFEARLATPSQSIPETERTKYQRAEIQHFADQINATEEVIRQKILVNEVEKARKLYQTLGYDLNRVIPYGEASSLDFSHPDKDVAFGIGRETMLKEGTLREAFITANQKLLLLGLEPYTLKLRE